MVVFERMHTLHGLENTLVDLYTDRPAMEALADRFTDVRVILVLEVARRFPDRIDDWNMSDDGGTQEGAFVPYEFLMDFFAPRYQRVFDAMHEAGCDVWVHSCGHRGHGRGGEGVYVRHLQQVVGEGVWNAIAPEGWPDSMRGSTDWFRNCGPWRSSAPDPPCIRLERP